MSLSFFKFGRQQSSPSGNTRKDADDSAPLSLSQALLITAGLAGLVGLFCGVAIRFSLSNSSEARFLSPLQTFPALSDWAPELPQGTADSHYLPGGRETQLERRNSQRQLDPFYEPKPKTNRYQREDAGPAATDSEDSFPPEESYPDAGYVEAPYAEESYTEDSSVEEPYVEAPYAEESYAEESYVEAPYVEEPYIEAPYIEAPYVEDSSPEESYAEDDYAEPYPAVEAPAAEAPYYEGDF